MLILTQTSETSYPFYEQWTIGSVARLIVAWLKPAASIINIQFLLATLEVVLVGLDGGGVSVGLDGAVLKCSGPKLLHKKCGKL